MSNIKAKLNVRGVRDHFLAPISNEKSVSVRSKSDESCHLLSDKSVNKPDLETSVANSGTIMPSEDRPGHNTVQQSILVADLETGNYSDTRESQLSSQD